MRIIPLHLSLAATRLDPSRPDYAIRTIGLYEDNGEHAAARAMREGLIARLEPSIALLEEEGMVVPTVWMDGGDVIPASPEIDSKVEPVVQTLPAELMMLDWNPSGMMP